MFFKEDNQESVIRHAKNFIEKASEFGERENMHLFAVSGADLFCGNCYNCSGMLGTLRK